MNIEIEFRALLSENDFLSIKKTLLKKGIHLGNDSKRTIFYIWEDRFGKITHNEKTKLAKLSMKLGKVSKDTALEEIEFYLDYADRGLGERLLESFEPKDIQTVYQFRDNYQYKGIDIAVKYTQSWGFHVEFEKMITHNNQKDEAEKAILDVAKDLGCKVMTTDEIKEYTARMDKGHNFGKYSEENYPYK